MWMQELMRIETINEFLKQMNVPEVMVDWKQVRCFENVELRLESSINPPMVVLHPHS